MKAASYVRLAAVLLMPALVEAQVVRGAVIDRGTDAPLAGTLVLLVDSAGTIARRALTDDAGEYRLHAPAAGTYRVRTLRIGFRPVTSDPFTLHERGELEKRLVIAGIPVALDTIRVVGRNACRVLGDSSAASYRIWEQARTALTAAQLTAGTRNIEATIVTYRRALDPDRGHVLEQQTELIRGVTTRPWHTIPADSIRRLGYITLDAQGWTTFHAPDLDILLSDSFVEDHCFRLAPQSDASHIGLIFEPARNRRRMPEIRGTLWLNRSSSELRRMDFEYVNVPRPIGNARAGGELQFARMRNSAWVISRWNIRMPEIQTRQVATMDGRFYAGTRAEEYVRTIRVEGGELSMVARGRDTLWTGSPLTLAGRVLDSATGRRVPIAEVALRGTSIRSVSDSSGQFTIRDFLPGQYTVDVRTPALDSIGAIHSLRVTLTDDDSAIVVRVPSGQQVVQSLCGPDSVGVVAGRIRVQGAARRPPHVKIVAEWTDSSKRVVDARPRRQWLQASMDAHGAYRICGVPIETAVELRAESDSLSASPVTIRIPRGRRFAPAELILDMAAARPAVMAGVVLSDVSLQPVADAEITIPALARSTFTSDRGEFRITDIAPGAHLVVVRRLGYKPFSQHTIFTANRTVQRQFLLRRVITLDTIAVTATGRIQSFDEHRRLGLGRFLTREQLEKQHGRKLSEVLAQVPGVRVMPGPGNRAWIASSRGSRTYMNEKCVLLEGLDRTVCRCFAQVYLDGIPLFKGEQGGIVPDINRMLVSSIEAIEYYAGPAQTPLKYSTLNSQCGTLVIHTRRQ